MTGPLNEKQKKMNSFGKWLILCCGFVFFFGGGEWWSFLFLSDCVGSMNYLALSSSVLFCSQVT